MLVIQAQGKHSYGVTIPDRFISVDDVHSPRSTPVICVSSGSKPQHTFDSAEVGAIAHLYRGEVYRSTIWRTRLDNTTNWAIVTMGIALSTTFASPEASPLPLLLVVLLLAVLLVMDGWRY